METDYSPSDEDKETPIPSVTAPAKINRSLSATEFQTLPLKSVVKIFVTKVFVKYSSP